MIYCVGGNDIFGNFLTFTSYFEADLPFENFENCTSYMFEDIRDSKTTKSPLLINLTKINDVKGCALVRSFFLQRWRNRSMRFFFCIEIMYGQSRDIGYFLSRNIKEFLWDIISYTRILKILNHTSSFCQTSTNFIKIVNNNNPRQVDQHSKVKTSIASSSMRPYISLVSQKTRSSMLEPSRRTCLSLFFIYLALASGFACFYKIDLFPKDIYTNDFCSILVYTLYYHSHLSHHIATNINTSREPYGIFHRQFKHKLKYQFPFIIILFYTILDMNFQKPFVSAELRYRNKCSTNL